MYIRLDIWFSTLTKKDIMDTSEEQREHMSPMVVKGGVVPWKMQSYENVVKSYK